MRNVYIGRDNTFDLILQANGIPINADAFTRWVLYMRDPKTGTEVTIDSNTATAGTFVASNELYYMFGKVKVLRCKLGGAAGLVANTVYECWLRVYNATFTTGLVWPDHDDTFRVRVLSGP